MKRIKQFVPILLLCSIVFSCEKIDDPIIKKTPIRELIEKYYPGNADDYNQNPNFTANTNTNRNVLIEDYTGHLCANCPAAAIIAKDIEAAHPGRVFILSVHASNGSDYEHQFFQNPHTSADPDYPKFSHDFRTLAGYSYTTKIPGFIGNPSGMISRTISQEGTPWNHSTNKWQTATEDILTANDLKANIQIIYNYYPDTKGLFVHYEVEALQELGNNTKVIILVLQKEFISEQKDNNAAGGEVDDYHHHNFLVGNLSGIFGDALSGETIKVGDKITGLVINGLSEINTVHQIDENNMAVVAMVVNSDTYEIYQVIMEDIIF